MITYINQTENTNWDRYEERFEEIFKRTCTHLKIEKDYDVSIVLVSPEEIHQINRDYRQIDRPTDVISFALKDSQDEVMLDEIDLELGDIFINVEAVVNQAKEYGHSECREISFLCTHGLLHLLGYDHMNEEDEKEMFHLQDVILDGLSFRKFKAAFNGLYMCFKDFSIRIQIVITLCVIAFGFVYKFNSHEWMWIISCIMLVLVCEVFNTAIEKICDLIDHQYNESIKVIKDLAAGAVLIASINAIIVGCIILKGVLR